MRRNRLCRKCRKRFEFDGKRPDLPGADVYYLGAVVVGIAHLCSKCAVGDISRAQAVPFDEVEVFTYVTDDGRVALLTAVHQGRTIMALANVQLAQGVETTRKRLDVAFEPKNFAALGREHGLQFVPPESVENEPL
jgi:hypothetical protein